MSDSEKRQRKALAESACRTANSAARLEIFILRLLREYGASTNEVQDAVKEAKEGKFHSLDRLFKYYIPIT